MPKLKEVAADEIETLIGQAQNLAGDAHDLTRRLETNLRSPIPKAVQSASSVLAASRALGDLAHALLIRASLAEQKRDIRTMVEARAREQ